APQVVALVARDFRGPLLDRLQQAGDLDTAEVLDLPRPQLRKQVFGELPLPLPDGRRPQTMRCRGGPVGGNRLEGALLAGEAGLDQRLLALPPGDNRIDALRDQPPGLAM